MIVILDFFRNLGTTNFEGHQWLVLKILLLFQVNTKNIRKTSFVATLVFSMLTTKFTPFAVLLQTLNTVL